MIKAQWNLWDVHQAATSESPDFIYQLQCSGRGESWGYPGIIEPLANPLNHIASFLLRSSFGWFACAGTIPSGFPWMETWRIPRFCSVHQQYLFLGKQNRIRTNIDNQDWTNICENWSYNYPLINKNSWLKTGNLPFAIKNTCTFIAAFQPVLFRLEGTPWN